MRGWLILLLIVVCFPTFFFTSAVAQPPQVPSASQQIAAAVLPLPEVMREHATVLGYAPDLSLVTLRQGSNGMVCTASRPGDGEFDVRCYHESFMPVVRRMRALYSQGVKHDEVYRTIDAVTEIVSRASRSAVRPVVSARTCVVSKLKCPLFVASEMSGIGFKVVASQRLWGCFWGCGCRGRGQFPFLCLAP